MAPKNIELYKRNGLYFIKDQYQKDTYFESEDAYNYYDIDLDKIRLFKQSDNEYFIRYSGFNKMEIVPLQLKTNNFYYEIKDYNNGANIIYIENCDKGIFETMREIWNNIIKLININNAPNFVQNTLYDNSKHNEANVLENTNLVKNNCYKDELIIVLHCH